MNFAQPETLRKAGVISLLVIWGAFPVSPALTSIALVSALVFWAFWKIRSGKKQIQIDKQILTFLVLYLVWGLASVLWSEARPQSLSGIFKVLQQVAMFLLAADFFRERDDFKNWERLFLIVTLVVLIDGLFQYAVGRDFLRGYSLEDSGSGARIKGPFKTYGLLACYLIMTLPVFSAFAIRMNNPDVKQKAIFWISTLAGIGLLFFTRSRGAMLAFTAGLAVFLFIIRRFKLLIAMIVALPLCVLILPRHVVLHLNVEKKEQSVVERYHLWRRALNVIQARPLTGTGINTYAVAHQKYDREQNWRVRNYYAHNGYLQMGAELGITGVLIFLTFLFLFFRRVFAGLLPVAPGGLSEKAVDLGFMTALINFLLFASVDTVLHNPQPVKMFWYMMGLLYARLRVSKNLLDPPIQNLYS